MCGGGAKVREGELKRACKTAPDDRQAPGSTHMPPRPSHSPPVWVTLIHGARGDQRNVCQAARTEFSPAFVIVDVEHLLRPIVHEFPGPGDALTWRRKRGGQQGTRRGRERPPL